MTHRGKRMRGYAWVCVIASVLSCVSCSADRLQDISTGWRLSLEDKEDFARPDCDDSSWITVDIPGKFFKEQKKQRVWVRKKIIIPESSRHENLSLFFRD